MITQQKNTTVKKFGLPGIILILGLSVLLCGEAYFGYRLHRDSIEQEQMKQDYSMLNNITFGLFSVDQWRDKMVGVVNHQVHDFTMTAEQKKDLQKEVEQQLHNLITKTAADINKPQKTLGGKLKKLAFNSFVDTDDVQAQVPSFAKTIIDKVNSPASHKRLKNIATTKISQLAHQTYDSTAVTQQEVTKYLFKKYHVSSLTAFNKEITSRLTAIRTVTYNYAYAMLGCVLVALGLWWLMRKHVQLQTTLFVMSQIGRASCRERV